MNQQVFIDKLCERLAVEQAGVRLYEAVLARVDDADARRRLDRFRRDEIRHRDLIAAHLERANVSDEARETASVRLARAEGEAMLKLVDECAGELPLFNLLLTVELTDETGWELLIDLARDAGEMQLVESFAGCLRAEKEHLRTLRGLVAERARAALESHADAR